MKKLAIEGHKTRGNEVIELLEMLGGKNFQRLNGALSKCYYIIDNQSISVCMSVEDDYVVYTLEEFKEKFPFNVGDMVSIPDYEYQVKIVGMEYFNLEYVNVEHVFYKVYRADEEECYSEEELLDINDIKDYESCYTKTNDTVDISSRTLGIKGHSNRSEDVKSLLIMLGGRIDVEDLPFDVTNFVFYIGNNKCVYCTTESSFNGVIYSLEEFEEKFPYKIGDKVIIKCKNKKAIVNNVVWRCDTIVYDLKYDGTEGKWTTEYLQPYKEIITIDDFKENTKEWLIDNLQSMSKENTLQTISNLYHEIHKPKYPKTYAECCGVIGFGGIIGFTGLADEEEDLYAKFIILKRCRDAYWKIAGEEMGLGKPWEPDWNEETDKFTISNKCNKIYLNNTIWYSEILAFPTAEIRNTFYENFKNLIEQCKELL